MRYRSKVVEIDAMEYDGTNRFLIIKWAHEGLPEIANSIVTFDGNSLAIRTLEGTMTANPGDFIIKGTEGEFYPCNPSVFHRKYTDEPIGKMSDGYHTFDDLYEHRLTLWIALCRIAIEMGTPQFAGNFWRSKIHSDGSSFDGWFVLGYGTDRGRQITYHLPLSKWHECEFVSTLERAPEYDGHTSDDVLKRLKRIP